MLYTQKVPSRSNVLLSNRSASNMRFQDITPDSICACIPARYASNRLHAKLLYDIGGQSVLERTARQALKCKWISKVFILTDHEIVADTINKLEIDDNIVVILNKVKARNGSERIGRNLPAIPEEYKIIVNIQGDEPFVDERNVDFVIEKHIEAHKESLDDSIFFSTLHQEVKNLEYLQQTSCVKIIVNQKNDAMLFTRATLPWNKRGVANKNTRYFGCTGLYVFNRERVEEYCKLEDTPLQLEEDVEQLKVLEHGYKIKTFECPHFNEISVNTENDYHYLLSKYGFMDSSSQSD